MIDNESERISEVKIFIQNLPYKDRELIESHIQDYVDIIANHKPHLYKCGA